MKHDVQHEIELRRYLLGELSLEEQVLVGQRLFLDSEYAEVQQAVEDELIDEYLANELKGSERTNFENHFLLLPEHGADLRIAQALKKYLATENVHSETGENNTGKDRMITFLQSLFLNKPRLWLSLTVATLIVLSVIVWIVFRSTRGPAADAPLQTRDPRPEQTRPDQGPQPTPLLNNDNRVENAKKNNSNGSGVKRDKPPERQLPAVKTAIFTLIGGGATRSAGATKTVTIEANTEKVVFRLPLEFIESYESYRAELLSGERRVKRWRDLRSEDDDQFGSLVSVSLAADRLREQSYRIKLHAFPPDQHPVEPPVTYEFTVVKK